MRKKSQRRSWGKPKFGFWSEVSAWMGFIFMASTILATVCGFIFMCSAHRAYGAEAKAGAVKLGFKGKSIIVVMPKDLMEVTRYPGILAPIKWAKVAGYEFKGLYFGDIGICTFWLYCCHPEQQYNCEVVGLSMPTFLMRDGQMVRGEKYWIYCNGIPVEVPKFTSMLKEYYSRSFEGSSKSRFIRLLTTEGPRYILLPPDIPQLVTKWSQIRAQGKNCVIRVFYEPDKQFKKNPYLWYYEFFGYWGSPVILGLKEVKHGVARFWRYDQGKPILITAQEWAKIIGE